MRCMRASSRTLILLDLLEMIMNLARGTGRPEEDASACAIGAIQNYVAWLTHDRERPYGGIGPRLVLPSSARERP